MTREGVVQMVDRKSVGLIKLDLDAIWGADEEKFALEEIICVRF